MHLEISWTGEELKAYTVELKNEVVDCHLFRENQNCTQ